MISKVWNIDNGHCLQVFNGHTQNVYCVLFSSAARGARYFASCGLDTSVRVWDLDAGYGIVNIMFVCTDFSLRKCKASLNSHTSLVSQLVFTPTKLISGSAEGKITMFDMLGPEETEETPRVGNES